MALLKVENVKKSFGQTEVLCGVDLALEQGEVLSIIGSSGSGKTTLLRCLNFLETPDAGRFYLDGELLYDAETMKKLSDAELRLKRLNFGLVFQQFNLFPQYNVLDNVTLAPRLAAKERLRRDKAALMEENSIKTASEWRIYRSRVFADIDQNAMELIAKVGLSDKLTAYPCELSGGQQQRVAIARALALSPKVLFFDEPTSALDPELTGEILKVIRSLAERDMTMIIVTHEMSFAREISDKVIFMDGGVVLEYGTPEEVMVNSQNERVRQFLNKLEG